MFRTAMIGCFLVLGACYTETPDTSTTTAPSTGGGGDGGTGGTADGGGGTTLSTTSSGGDVGGGGGTTSTVTVDQCQQEACADLECGFTTADCNGDGIKDHVDCGGCTAPAACIGSNEPNKCGSKCLAKPEYTAACGEDVEFACDNTGTGCGFAYKYGPDGKPIYKVVGVDCPTAIAPDGKEVRCCTPGCGGDC